MHELCASLKGCLRPLIAICLLAVQSQLSAQCYPPPELPTQYCFPAPLVCLQDICYSTVPWGPDFFAEPEDWCLTNNPSHHPHYYQFQATAVDVQIFISVISCHGQDLCGLQAVIIDQCAVGFNPWTAANIVACDAQACINQQLILAPTNMVPGNYYWLMIDNDGDAFCSYQIDVVQGVYMPDITEEVTHAYPLDTIVCPGQDVWLARVEPALTTVQGYLWTGFPWAPGYHVAQYANMAGGEYVTIPDDAPPGIYEICVQGFTACDTTDTPYCFNIEIRDLNGISEPVTLCPEEFGPSYTWEGITINGPGLYTQSYLSAEGCPYDSTKEFMSHPETFEGFIDTVLCDEYFLYEGEEYFNPGYYSLYYEGGNSYGCDSFAILDLDITYIEAETDFHCLNGTFVFNSEIIIAVPNQGGLQYAWYRDDTVLVSTSPGFVTNVPGTYELFLTSFQCTFPAVTNPIVIDLDELVPPKPSFNQADTLQCANEFATYSVNLLPDPIMRFYEWTVQPAGVPFTVHDTLNSRIQVNWQGYTGGTVCANAVNHCGMGRDTCFDVTVIPAPTAAFNMPGQVCADSTITVLFTGVAGPDATFLWNFAGGTVHSGGSGPGPHVISWGNPGQQTVSLQVFEVECDTSVFTQNIVVEHLGTPVISCNSTVNSVTFEWSPVPGAVSYQVNVLQGPTGTIVDDTSYVVTGLAAGTTVQIQLIASGIGACPPGVATATCIAQNCPPRMLQIQIPQDTFCLGDVSGTIPLSALVDGSPASGIWSGLGVNPAGTFDPHHPAAGPGVHTIVFMYNEGTCLYQRSRNVTVIATPTATFSASAVICQSSSATVQYTGSASVNATYLWDFGSGTATGNGPGPYSVTWNTPGMHPVSLIVEEGGCPSAMETHVVDVQPAIGMPSISCFPTTSSVTIQWSLVPNATTYDVTHLFGPMGSVNGNQYVVNGLTPGDSVSIQIEISGNTICPPVIVQASCVAQECPMPVIAIDPVDDVCLYAGTGAMDLNVTITNGNGSGSWTGNGITDAQQGIFNPVLAGAGSHLIEFIYMESGCTFVESITIDVFDPPVAVISNTSFTITCDDGELVLDGSTSQGGGGLTYTWSTTNGVIIGPTNQPTATAGAAGDYTLTVVDNVSQCEDVVSVSLVEDTGLPTADAGPDGLVNCRRDTVVLGGNSSSGPSFAYAWSSSDGGLILSDPTAATIVAGSGGTFSITVTDMDNGCTAVDQVVVSEDHTQPDAMLSVAGILDCDVATTTVTAIPVAPGSYTYTWTTVNGQILSGNGTAAIMVDRSGTYTLTLTSQANGCSNVFSTQVFADPEVISGLDVVLNPPECPGDADGSIHLIEVINGMPPFNYSWSNQSSGTILQLLSPGSYTITVTDARGCTFQETFTFPEPIAMNPDIGIDLYHDYGEEVTIIVTVQDIHGVADVIWEGVAPSCPGCFENTFTAEFSGKVMVTVIDTNGCVASDTLFLTVDKNTNVFIPNIFSPNGDNINDIFRIQGKLLERIEDFRVYDRWGDLVYTRPDGPPGSDGWDGTAQGGRELAPAVYVYIARLYHSDGTDELVTGTVTLLR